MSGLPLSFRTVKEKVQNTELPLYFHRLAERYHHPSLSGVFSRMAISSVQFSCSVVSYSLQPHELQHARTPCPSPTPGVHSDSSPSSPWCHPDISFSVIPFFSCPQSLPASESFPMSQLCMRWPKPWSFSFSIIPSKEIPRPIFFRMDWLDLLTVQGTLKSLLQHHSSKASILQHSAFFTVQLSHPYMKFRYIYNILLLLSRFCRVRLYETP